MEFLLNFAPHIIITVLLITVIYYILERHIGLVITGICIFLFLCIAFPSKNTEDIVKNIDDTNIISSQDLEKIKFYDNQREEQKNNIPKSTTQKDSVIIVIVNSTNQLPNREKLNKDNFNEKYKKESRAKNNSILVSEIMDSDCPFNPYINDGYIILESAFSSESNAQNRVNILKNKGFNNAFYFYFPCHTDDERELFAVTVGKAFLTESAARTGVETHLAYARAHNIEMKIGRILYAKKNLPDNSIF